MFLIEKNVPLAPKPAGSLGVSSPFLGVSKYPFLAMEIGDSFFWPGVERSVITSRAGNAVRSAKDGRKYAIRIDKDAGGFRCWRVA